MIFDLSQIQISKNDLTRGLRLPTKPSAELAECIGIIIGDGYLYEKKYTIGVVGDPSVDKKYIKKVQEL